MLILGAGQAGLLAARRLSLYNPIVLEKQKSLPNNHSALLRFRSNEIGKAIGLPFKKVNVYKGILSDDGETITDTPTIRDMNAYSLKSTGVCIERSIINTDKLFRGQRYWFKNDPATILLFDKNGYIAGIQTSVTVL